jgi:hypothetical protein
MVDFPAAGQPVYIGHLKVDVGAGVNGDPSASSLLPNQQVKRTPNAKKLMAGTECIVPGSDQHPSAQTRPYSNEQKVPTAFGMRSRQNSGEKVPAARRSNFGVGR